MAHVNTDRDPKIHWYPIVGEDYWMVDVKYMAYGKSSFGSIFGSRAILDTGTSFITLEPSAFS